MIRTYFIVISTLIILPYAFRSNATAQQAQSNVFPKNFLFGVTTSALACEGAWNESDKGESVWDSMLHANPALVTDRSNADVASDFYHKYQEDIRRAKSIGTQIFKLSLSWTRILPSGFINHVSQNGVKFYRNVIDEILANGMTPMVTIFELDLPNVLQKMGGLTNSMFVDWFTQYARFVFATFGDKVKMWITIGEPNFLCIKSYGFKFFIPGINLSGIADYLCGHYALLAHAKAFHLYNREFRSRQKGSVGITNHYIAFTSTNSSSDKDVKLEDSYVWYNRWLMDPIFTSGGDYPHVMKERIESYSRMDGSSVSRLPKFTGMEIRDIQGSADFLGLNYFGHEIVKTVKWNKNVISLFNDAGASTVEYLQQDTPWFFAQMIQHVNRDYHRPIIYIETGYPDTDHLEDIAKATYLRRHLAEVLKALQNGVDIRGYTIWSLLDSFDWMYGYQRKYGLFRVDFNNPHRTRTPRLSSRYIARVYKTRTLEKLDDLDLHTLKDNIE